MPDVCDVPDVLRDEVTDPATSHFDDFADAAIEDGEAFLGDSKDNLEEWTQLLVEGNITQDEFRSLVEGKKDLAEMEALKRAGLAAVRVDKFRNELIDRVLDATGRVLL